MPRINHNIPAMITGGALRNVGRDMGKSLERLSTGLRINRASDDAAGLSVSESLRTQVKGLGMANRNAMDGISAINIAEGAANEISSMLQRMREISIQADNDTLTGTERGYLDQEFQALSEEITRTADATEFNGMALINGGVRGDASIVTAFGSGGVGAPSILHIGANNTSNIDRITIQIADVKASSLGLGASNVLTGAGASAAINSLDSAIDSVNQMRSDLGAYVNRLEHTITNLDNQEQNMQAAESIIRDVDFARETTAFTRNQILQQSSTSMLSQANQLPQSVLSLLQG